MALLDDIVASLATPSSGTARLVLADVTSVQEDGTINVQYLGSPISGIMRLDTYDQPASGDSVAMLVIDGTFLVLGRHAGNATPPAPAGYTLIEPTLIAGYTGVLLNLDTPAQGANEEGEKMSGGWFYDGDIMTTIGTAAVIDIQIYLVRDKTEGEEGPIPIILALHSDDGPPPLGPHWIAMDETATVALDPGEARWWSLPPSWVALLRSGTARGLGVASSDPTEYLLMDPNSGTLAIKL